MDTTEAPLRPRKGRGAVGNATGRFESEVRLAFDDGWGSLDEEPLPLDTTYTRDSSRSIIAHNARNLPYQAAACAAFGLPKEIALRSVTLAPAQIFGLADKIGSLETGKLANIIVTDGDPLEIVT